MPWQVQMATLTGQLDDWLKDEILAFWRQHDAGPSSALRHIAEEWWTMQEYAAITFRDGVAGRRAALRGGPDIWEVVRVARAYGAADRAGFYDHFAGTVEADALDQALAYAEHFAAEIDGVIAENTRLEALVEQGIGV
jgi:hypothetical protein